MNSELLNDSTGDGMAGAIDPSMLTQQQAKDTLYNGSKQCSCGFIMNPYESLTSDLCPSCSRGKATKLKKNGMTP